MTKLFTQCRLLKLTEDMKLPKESKTYMVSWIPAHCAVSGSLVELKDPRTFEPTYFKVLETFHTVEQGILDQIRKNERGHRGATDI